MLHLSLISSLKMSLLWICVLFLYVISPAQSLDLSFISVKSGESISLNCPFVKAHSIARVVWYKQIFGQMPQQVGERAAYKQIQISPKFKMSGLKMEMTDGAFSLKIPRINKDDGGLYYCAMLTWENFTLYNGTFLDVSGDGDVKVSVSQIGVSDSVPAGASVTLQCSVLSESRAAELQVVWFRAAPSQSHPQIIYTQHSSSSQCESGSSTHTCVYSFSKNIHSLNDTGTYYCAVAVCGKIVFGNGTRLQMEAMNAFSDQCFKETTGSHFVAICLAVALVVCVVVNCAQAILYCQKRNPERSTVRPSEATLMEKTHNQGRDAVELNYAALSFGGRKPQSGKAKKRQHQDAVYSQVIHTPVT